jgi:hypothetical protein
LIRRKQRLLAYPVLPAWRLDAVRLALNYPAPDAGGVNLKEHSRLLCGQQISIDPADGAND